MTTWLSVTVTRLADTTRFVVATRFAVKAAAVAAAVVGFGFVAVTPAHALSCVSPSPSPYAFTGVVVSADWDGRIAVVRADGGAVVEVRGTPADSDDETTMADRNYDVDARYEFHPYNAVAPFEDNACSMTRLVDASAPAVVHPGVIGTEPTGGTGSGQSDLDDGSSTIPRRLSVLGLVVFVGAVAVAAVAAVTVALSQSRRRGGDVVRKLP